MKSFFLYVLLFLLAQSAYATSIVVLITPDYILLGTESRRTLLDAQSNVTSHESVCKIHKAGNYCFALAGFVASRSTAYSADSIVSYYLNSAKNYDSAVAGMTAAVKKALQKEFTYQKLHQREAFQKTKASKGHILEIVILSVQHRAPHLQIVGFELADKKQMEVKEYTASCPGDCPATKGQFYVLGQYQGIEKYLDSEQDISDPVTLVEQLIMVQSKTTPQTVGAPVNMVKFTAGGMEWIK